MAGAPPQMVQLQKRRSLAMYRVSREMRGRATRCSSSCSWGSLLVAPSSSSQRGRPVGDRWSCCSSRVSSPPLLLLLLLLLFTVWPDALAARMSTGVPCAGFMARPATSSSRPAAGAWGRQQQQGGRLMVAVAASSSGPEAGTAAAAAAALGGRAGPGLSSATWEEQTREPVQEEEASSSSSVVDELLASGTLKIVRRPDDYEEKLKPDYQEPREMYLLGTSHVSESSARDVARLIQQVRPDAVVVELCKSRSALVALNSSSLLDQDLTQLLFASASSSSSASSEGPLDRSARLAGGRGPLLLQYLLSWSVRSLASKLRITFGDEFKAAQAAAKQVGAQLVLGDRPIELTMRRAWGWMGAEERGALLLAALALLVNIRDLVSKESAASSSSGLSSSEELVDRGQVLRLLQGTATAGSGGVDTTTAPRTPDDEDEEEEPIVSSSVVRTRQALQTFFPGLYAALISERDAYLAWAIKRSKAVNRANRVVAVMGLLHLSGVEDLIRRDRAGDLLRFSTVARLPEPCPSTAAKEQEGEEAGGGGVRRLDSKVLVQQTAMLWLRHKGPGVLTNLALGAAMGQLLGLVGPRLWEEVASSPVLMEGGVLEGLIGGGMPW